MSCPGNVLSGKRLSGKVIVRETSVTQCFAPHPWDKTSMGELRTGRNVQCGAKRLWTFRPKSMRWNLYGWIAHGAKCLVWGETSMGRIAHINATLRFVFDLICRMSSPPLNPVSRRSGNVCAEGMTVFPTGLCTLLTFAFVYISSGCSQLLFSSKFEPIGELQKRNANNFGPWKSRGNLGRNIVQ